MNEELKIIITAEISKLKANVEKAKNEVKSFQDQVKKASGDVEGNFKKLGDGIGNAVKTGAKVATAAVATVSAALAGFVTSSVKQYAEYEQLVGGVEKLFGDSSATVMKYAQDAYKTAGVSANDYMTQVTSFSASLISSLNGDTAEAARVADMAIRDMADNANVFGSNIEDIQNAYQGFAKQNYTMLDNLKLGYGGTKEEMQRLIDDANNIKVAMGETADLTIDSYSDVIEAIHLVQGEMQITGTTAKEAEGTISGSIAMTKAAWDNLMVGLADSNANIPQLVSDVVGSATNVIKNIIPIVKEVLKSIPAAISEISPEAGAAMQKVVDVMAAVLPKLMDALKAVFKVITEVINFISEHQTLFAAIAAAIGTVTAAVVAYNAVAAVKAAMAAAEVTTLGALISAYAAQAVAMAAAIAPYVAIVAAIGAVIAIIVTCIKHWDEIKAVVERVMKAIGDFVKAGVDAVVNFFKSMMENVKNIMNSLKEAVMNVWNAIKSGIDTVLNAIKTAVTTAWNAIKSAVEAALNGIKNTVTTVWNGIKSAIETVLNVIKTVITTAWNAYKTLITGELNAIKAVVQGVWDAIKLVFSTVLGVIKGLVTGDFNLIKTTISNSLTEAKNIVTNIFNNIKDAIGNAINGAKDIVKKGIDAIKGFFNFKWELPKIKLPHFKISGKFSLNPPSIPHFSVDWYAKGGVFDAPTLFGYGNGRIGGLGEAGAEAIVPLEKNTKWLTRIADILSERGGNRPIILQVDKRVLAETTVDGINDLTRQTGDLPLKLM